MKILKIRHFKWSPVFGLGFWKDDYHNSIGPECYTYNLLLPFMRIQWGQLKVDWYSQDGGGGGRVKPA